jgi:triacylglycerol esterase/lipase EstA (alpha/beta hydrolase family)
MRALEVVGAVYLLLAFGCFVYVLASYSSAFVRRGIPWRAFFAELGATLVMMPLWPLWMMVGATYRVQHEGRGRPRGNPVVLLHGLMMNRTNWAWLGRRLVRAGIGPLYGATYFSPQSVQRSAERLGAFIDYVRSREDVEQVDIIAHSLGGVVSRYFIECMQGASKVGRLITIASPHKGTRWAHSIFRIPAVNDIVVDSQLLGRLGKKPDGVEYVSIWSPHDAMIVPAEAASVEPLGKDEVVPHLGHLSLLISTRVAEVVRRALSRDIAQE